MLRWKWQSYRSKRLAQCSAEHFTVELFSLANWNSYASRKTFLSSWMDSTRPQRRRFTRRRNFDRYWDAPNGGPWLCVRHHRRISGEVINLLSDEIARTQQLCSAREA